LIRKKILEIKEEQEYLSMDKKDAPKPEDSSKRPASAAPKPAEVPKRPSSAAPKAEKKPVALKDKIKPAELAKIEASIKKDKEAVQTVMFLVHDVCFERFQAYE
jgi:hypothetical protein